MFRKLIGAIVMITSLLPCRGEDVRPAAVAGLFYPKDKTELMSKVDALLAAAKAESLPGLKAIIVPHAGYEYSGPIAASGFKLLQGRKISTVFLLGPTHTAHFQGAAVSPARSWTTPLGSVPVSPLAAKLGTHSPFTLQPKAVVQRPAWARQSSRPMPAAGTELPETWEHSLEVELPFLQRVLGDFSLVPAVCGPLDPQAAAQALGQVVDDNAIIVVSSDLSHYKPYDEARVLDRSCINAVLKLDGAVLKEQEACGLSPITVLVELARTRHWKTKLLDYRNSGDTAGDKTAVVGYAAIAFYTDDDTTTQPPAVSTETSGAQGLTREDGRRLIELARKTLNQLDQKPNLPDADSFPSLLREKKGCFVTLKEKGELRGCIGHILPQEALYKAVIENTINAALNDPRFPPVGKAETRDIRIEVSVLTEPEPLVFSSPEDLLAKLHPHEDGVVLNVQGRISTFLPQVWEQLADKVEFLNHLSQKAGRPPDAWRKPGTSVQIYHVQPFEE